MLTDGASRRAYLARWLVVLALAIPALAQPALLASPPAQAQGDDLLVWVSVLDQEYGIRQIEYRDRAGQTLANYTLPSAPLQFDSQAGGRFIGSDLQSIVLFDPRWGEVQYLSVPGLALPLAEGEDWVSVTGTALAPDGRYAYNITRQPSNYENPATTQVFVATQGQGTDRVVYELSHDSWMAIQPYRWRSDGGALMIHEMPQGIGGYILFWTYQNAYALDLNTGGLQFLGEAVDGISDDFTLVATIERDENYNPAGIAITDFTTNAIMRYNLPSLDETPMSGGDAFFSPDKTKVAYQLARMNPEREKFWTVVLDLTTGQSRVVLEDEAVDYNNQFGAIGGWLDNSTLAIGDFWMLNTQSAIVDVTTGTLVTTVKGAFVGRAHGVSNVGDFARSGSAAIVCPGAPPLRLTLGAPGRITIVDGTTTNVRSGPSMNADRVAAMPEGARFMVYHGPTCADGYAWWWLEFDNGVSGWVAEGTPTTYFLEPWQ